LATGLPFNLTCCSAGCAGASIARTALGRFQLEEESMKRVFVVVLILATLLLCVPIASGQTRRRHKRSFWRKHRDKLTVAGSSVAGAAVGGIAGGRKGAAIGAGAGAGAGAIYTYKIRHRRHRHRRPQ